MRDFRNLVVWQKAHLLACDVYASTSGFPPDERFGLTAQIRRAAASIPINLAEGCGRDGDPEFCNFVRIAAGSASELDYEILLADDLGYLPSSTAEELGERTREVRRMLWALERSRNPESSKPRANTKGAPSAP